MWALPVKRATLSLDVGSIQCRQQSCIFEIGTTCRSAVTAASSCCAACERGSSMRALPAAPLARPSTVSLVLVSPSTVICERQDIFAGKVRRQVWSRSMSSVLVS